MKEKILVLHTSFLGDSVLALPFLQRLRRREPGAEIHVLTTPKAAEVFAHSPAADKVLTLDKRGEHRTLAATAAFAKRTGKEGYTRLYSLHRSLRSSLFAWFSGIEETYGFSNAALSFFYKHIIRYNPRHHEVRRNLAMLGGDASDWKERPLLTLPESAAAENALQTGRRYKGIIGIAPGSVWETKRYPLEHFGEIARALLADGYCVLLLGSKDEKELCARMMKTGAEGMLDLSGTLGIIETTRVLAGCDLLLTNDSALTHFGMAADCRVLTIYCSTVPDFGFYPYNEKSGTIGIEGLPCKPCGIHGYRKCPLGHFDCGRQLMPRAVLARIQEILQGEKHYNT